MDGVAGDILAQKNGSFFKRLISFWNFKVKR